MGVLRVIQIIGFVLVITLTIVEALKSLAAHDAQAQIKLFFIKLLKKIAAVIGIVIALSLIM